MLQKIDRLNLKLQKTDFIEVSKKVLIEFLSTIIFKQVLLWELLVKLNLEHLLKLIIKFLFLKLMYIQINRRFIL